MIQFRYNENDKEIIEKFKEATYNILRGNELVVYTFHVELDKKKLNLQKRRRKLQIGKGTRLPVGVYIIKCQQ